VKKFVIILALLVATAAQARDPKVIREFRKTHPCPETAKITGACPGWVVDHGMPLCAGGADATYNLYWQKREDSYKKDADERRLCRKLKAAGLANIDAKED